MLNAHPSLTPSPLWGTIITLIILFLAGCNEPRSMYEYDCFASDNGCPTGFECRLGDEDRGICFEIPTDPTGPPYPESPLPSPLDTSDATLMTDVDVSDTADTRVDHLTLLWILNVKSNGLNAKSSPRATVILLK